MKILFLLAVCALLSGCVYARQGGVELNGFVYRSAIADRDATNAIEGGGSPKLELPLVK